MQDSQLNRVIRLIRRTGDKAVVLDQATNHVLVMMGIDDYEGLLGGRDESLDFIPPDDANVASPEPAEAPEFDETVEEATQAPVAQQTAGQGNKSKLNFSSDWAEANAQKTSRIASEEVSLADVPNEEEEEKFYLEPVE